jgi:Cupin superfamily protein
MSADLNLTATPDITAQSQVALKDVRLDIDPKSYQSLYNRTPFGFKHNLHQLEIFQFDSISELLDRYTGASNDYYVAGSAAAAGSAFFDAPHIKLTPKEASRQLDQRPTRILLKRLENHDDRFRKLLDLIIKQIRSIPGGLGDQPILRIQSSLFITSAASTTPLHFDPEVGFFTQIEGDKTYHVYSPDDVPEHDLEDFYVRGKVSIGQLDMAQRDPGKEQVYNLKAGDGFHQPQNAPHWVETCGSRSISYSCVFETQADRALGRTRAFNYYERKLGMRPSPPGQNSQLDSMKAEAIIPDRLARKVLDRIRHT